MTKFTKCFIILFISLACRGTVERKTVDNKLDVWDRTDIVTPSTPINTKQILIEGSLPQVTEEVTGRQLVDFAKTLLAIPYKYASSDPLEGFDCSGFITYVFNHFNIKVPRSSVDFTNTGNEVDIRTAKVGDLILFTGTVDTIRIVGHMGIVTENADNLKFIHSTSGKANAVTVSTLTDHYKRRFVKIIRVLSDK
ncbi:MAG: C40 family peptidase [Bacteroidia bacterium]|nr:C40 family peptidase [Bacteroidia bacterium]